MKKTLTLCILLSVGLFLGHNSIAQDQKDDKKKHGFMNMDRYSFYEIQRKAERYFSKEKIKDNRRSARLAMQDSAFLSKFPFEGREIDNTYHKYKRWEWYWRDRIDENGNFYDPTEHHQEYLDLQKQAQRKIQSNSNTRLSSSSSTWINVNQTTATGGYNGMGRATSVVFHPTDANTYYVGAPIGGIWKTTNGGISYAPLGDSLPYVSTGSIIVNYKKPSTLYISIGDHQGWWNYSLGVYKSYNGGISWQATQLSWAFTDFDAIRRIVMSPVDTSIVFAATTNGLYRTLNGGATWTRLRAGHHTDVIFKPNNGTGDGNIVYAGTDGGEIFRSANGGTTWTQVYTSNGNGVRLSVTIADPNTIAASHYGPRTVVVSRNQGTSFTAVTGVLNQNPDAFILSQINANTFYYGGVDLFKSTNAGASWTQITHWCCPAAGQREIHADFRNAAASVVNPNVLFFCNDGGVYYYNETTNVWTERTNGFIATQYYRVATAQNNNIVILGGTQDNGGRYRQPTGVWRASNGGDAMEVAVDPTNYNVMYSTYVNGQLYRTTNAWGGMTEITPGFSSGAREVGDWVAPFTLDPNNANTIVAGYKDVWRSTDRGTTWTKISTNLTGNQNLNQIAVAPGASNTIYASRANRLWKTTNGGTSWAALTVPGTENITSIAISSTNNATLWISRAAYNATSKVYKSTDAGLTWTNLSSGLPNVPVNSVVYENNSNESIFIGTDAGVFHRNAAMAGWEYYGYGMPNTSVTDLAIQYSSKKLRAATYGRGIWEIDISDPLPVSFLSVTAQVESNKSITLAWSTSSEGNNDYFIIERSEDGVHFNSIGEVGGSGTTNQVREYIFKDNYPVHGTNYYRIVQVDLSGIKNYSQVISENISTDFYVEVYPTVFHESIGVLIGSKEEVAKVELMDMKGVVLYQQNLKTNVKHQLNYSLSPGVYIVKITAGRDSDSRKVVKE